MRASTLVASALTLLLTSAATAAPSLVPPGWREVGDPGAGARTFVSPDGAARLRVGHIAADRRNLRGDMDAISYKDGESITYQRRGDSWVAVSGYRDDQIFYRKGNLACGQTRWHMVEFRYPREAKRQMDAAVTAVAHDMGAYGSDCR